MKKYTTKQQNIINELHNKDYFYTRYTQVYEMVRKQYKVNKKYMNNLIARELKNIEDNFDNSSLIWIANFG